MFMFVYLELSGFTISSCENTKYCWCLSNELIWNICRWIKATFKRVLEENTFILATLFSVPLSAWTAHCLASHIPFMSFLNYFCTNIQSHVHVSFEIIKKKHFQRKINQIKKHFPNFPPGFDIVSHNYQYTGGITASSWCRKIELISMQHITFLLKSFQIAFQYFAVLSGCTYCLIRWHVGRIFPQKTWLGIKYKKQVGFI